MAGADHTGGSSDRQGDKVLIPNCFICGGRSAWSANFTWLSNEHKSILGTFENT